MDEVRLLDHRDVPSGHLRPGRFTPDGLPVGIQIVGRHRDDFGVLQMAHAFEQATKIGKQRPSIASDSEYA